MLPILPALSKTSFWGPIEGRFSSSTHWLRTNIIIFSNCSLLFALSFQQLIFCSELLHFHFNHLSCACCSRNFVLISISNLFVRCLRLCVAKNIYEFCFRILTACGWSVLHRLSKWAAQRVVVVPLAFIHCFNCVALLYIHWWLRAFGYICKSKPLSGVCSRFSLLNFTFRFDTPVFCRRIKRSSFVGAFGALFIKLNSGFPFTAQVVGPNLLSNQRQGTFHTNQFKLKSVRMKRFYFVIRYTVDYCCLTSYSISLIY